MVSVYVKYPHLKDKFTTVKMRAVLMAVFDEYIKDHPDLGMRGLDNRSALISHMLYCLLVNEGYLDKDSFLDIEIEEKKG